MRVSIAAAAGSTTSARSALASARPCAVLCALLAALGPSSSAAADQVKGPGEPPHAPRVVHVPTAWLQPAGGVYASAGVNHRGGVFTSVHTGLGSLADVGVVLSDRSVACSPCDPDRNAEHLFEGSAELRIGVGGGTLWRGPPALALGFRRSFVTRPPPPTNGPELAELYLVATHSFAAVDIHGGARLWSARADNTGSLFGVRAFAGLQWRPTFYPRTTVLADFSYVPEFDDDKPRLRWIGGWGVRYQALAWGSIELAVRHRQGESFDEAAVLVRVNGSWQLF